MPFKEYLSKAFSYQQYKYLIDALFEQGKTTGHTQSEEYLDYAKINRQRMNRLEKTITLTPELKDVLKKVNVQYTFLAITEGWCGDASQNLPVFAAIEKACPPLTLKLVLRDDNPQLIDSYLTNGSRSIPKVIAFENDTLKQLFVWGPRPAILQKLVGDLVKNGVSYTERGLTVQNWYNQDKTQTLQHELTALIKTHMVR